MHDLLLPFCLINSGSVSDLSDKAMFTSFMRTQYTISQYSKLVAKLCQYYHWQHVALVTTSEPGHWSPMNSVMLSHLTDSNVTVVGNEMLPLQANDNMDKIDVILKRLARKTRGEWKQHLVLTTYKSL